MYPLVVYCLAFGVCVLYKMDFIPPTIRALCPICQIVSMMPQKGKFDLVKCPMQLILTRAYEKNILPWAL